MKSRESSEQLFFMTFENWKFDKPFSDLIFQLHIFASKSFILSLFCPEGQ